MYKAFCNVCERFLRIPAAPEPPPGDEHTTKIFRAAPNYFKYLVAVWSIQTVLHLVPGFVMLILFVVLGVNIAGAVLNIVFWMIILAIFIGASVVLALFRLAIIRLQYEKRWYIVTDRSLRVREGVLSVSEMTVNFANIQNISISQGPIQRWLQIADLKVDTAGGGGTAQPKGPHQMHNLHTAFFRGVSNALEIRELIQARLRHLKDSGLGDHDEHKTVDSATGEASVIAALRGIQEEARSLNAALQV